MMNRVLRKPNFLGIGYGRSGTTYLTRILEQHPQIFIPERKEIYFFTRNYHRGEAWYEHYYRDADENQLALGDFSPSYINPLLDRTPTSVENVIRRIKSFSSIRKLLILLRDPVTRYESIYNWGSSRGAFNNSSDEFIDWAIANEVADYHKHINLWFEAFGRDNVHCEIFEDMVNNPMEVIADICEFLGVDKGKLEDNVNFETPEINRGQIIRFQNMYSIMIRLGHRFRNLHLDKTVAFLKRVLSPTLFERKEQTSKHFSDAQKQKIYLHHKKEYKSLSRLIGKDITEKWSH